MEELTGYYGVPGHRKGWPGMNADQGLVLSKMSLGQPCRGHEDVGESQSCTLEGKGWANSPLPPFLAPEPYSESASSDVPGVDWSSSLQGLCLGSFQELAPAAGFQ